MQDSSSGSPSGLPDPWLLSRNEIEQIQLTKLNQLLSVARDHPLYRDGISKVSLPFVSLDQLDQLPILTKADMVAPSPGEPGRIFALDREAYCRYHQTSGTSGHPMPVLDTSDDWRWWMECWSHVLRAAEVTSRDVAMMAFSFGPFIGFWTATDALVQTGALVIPGGGMSTEARLQMVLDHRCTLLCCTPTYALHMVRVAEKHSINLRESNVSRIIVAGEPGGSSPPVRSRIEEGWNARVIDHSGASEVGAWGFGSQDGKGLHVIETEFIAECLHFDDSHPNGRKAQEHEEAELVLTGLGRHGGPAIRYRTGDVVRASQQHDHPCRFIYLDGGVLGRSDDMMVIRGVNVFPSSVEAIIRRVEPTAEFRMIATKAGDMDSLEIEVEATPDSCAQLVEQFQKRLAMRVDVKPVENGSLPRFEAKARRMVDQR